MTWTVSVLDRFSISARARARNTDVPAVRATIRSLRNGPTAEDRAYLLPPVLGARARRVPGSDLWVVFEVLGRNRLRVLALAGAA